MPQANWKAEFPDQMLVFEEKRKLEKPDKKTLEAEKKTNHKLKSDRISHRSKPELDPRPYCWRASAFITAPSKSPATHTKRNICIEIECFASYLFLPFRFSSTWFNVHKTNRQCLGKIQKKLNHQKGQIESFLVHTVPLEFSISY